MSKFDQAKKQSTPPVIDREWELSKQPQEGVVVSLDGDTIVIRNQSGNDVPHTIAVGATFTSDGEPCEIGDIQPGKRIRLIVHKQDRRIVFRAEYLNHNTEFKSLH